MSKTLITIFVIASSLSLRAQDLYKAPPPGTETRWVSPENPTGEKGKGGTSNKGAKGDAFFVIAPGEKKILFDVKGAGIIKKMWMSGSVAVNAEQRRSVRIDMYWDGAAKPAVSAPVGDFFGAGLGVMASYDNAFFSSPEGRSFNCHIPMPFRTAAKIVLSNESPFYVLYWYDIDYLQVKQLDKDAMYFHAFWNRVPVTTLGKDYEILPKVMGTGRYLGASIGVIGNPSYRGTWFGEGEVKGYLDGDDKLPTLVGTGTEDYIGSGWGQGQFHGRYYGSLVADTANDLYAFYRFHVDDPVYFHSDCKITIQQIGNTGTARIRDMLSKNAKLTPVLVFDGKGKNITQLKAGEGPILTRLLDQPLDVKNFPDGGINFYRSDDVSATAYFYLDKPQSNLPELPPLELRMKDMQIKVFDKTGNAVK